MEFNKTFRRWSYRAKLDSAPSFTRQISPKYSSQITKLSARWVEVKYHEDLLAREFPALKELDFIIDFTDLEDRRGGAAFSPLDKSKTEMFWISTQHLVGALPALRRLAIKFCYEDWVLVRSRVSPVSPLYRSPREYNWWYQRAQQQAYTATKTKFTIVSAATAVASIASMRNIIHLVRQMGFKLLSLDDKSGYNLGIQERLTALAARTAEDSKSVSTDEVVSTLKVAGFMVIGPSVQATWPELQQQITQGDASIQSMRVALAVHKASFTAAEIQDTASGSNPLGELGALAVEEQEAAHSEPKQLRLPMVPEDFDLSRYYMNRIRTTAPFMPDDTRWSWKLKIETHLYTVPEPQVSLSWTRRKNESKKQDMVLCEVVGAYGHLSRWEPLDQEVDHPDDND
ncbi:hypothetical protein BT63DRAFT_430408 [Microthyrium microscopicum]|uniref:Uncharacterized protein n=1 Tax=Microthyrium microscopicum TaxID=703497 RepID=A0A6A6TW71_9PEZI|nr:hypothetical protein BT63DRAFT_430408 [Microthyrium microscopicum]